MLIKNKYVMVQKDTYVNIKIPCDKQTVIDIERLAKEEGISVNDWIIRAVLEKMALESGKCGRDRRAGSLTDDTPPKYNAKE